MSSTRCLPLCKDEERVEFPGYIISYILYDYCTTELEAQFEFVHESTCLHVEDFNSFDLSAQPLVSLGLWIDKYCLHLRLLQYDCILDTIGVIW